MAEVKDRPAAPAPEATVTVDGQFLREQASEAVFTFLSPFTGVFTAAKGKAFRGRTRGKRKAKTA